MTKAQIRSEHRKKPNKEPELYPVTMTDILEALAAGLRDFRKEPVFGLFFGGIYMLCGWMLILLLLFFDMPYLVYPLAGGFALIAPFIATGFYAVSRMIEAGEKPDWVSVAGYIKGAGSSDLGWMAVVTGFSLFIWMDIAALLYFGFLGMNMSNFSEFLRIILTTPEGLLFLFIGNAAGAIIAAAVFSFSVVSFPMLFDRDIDFVTAMITSVKVVTGNMRPMIIWCAIIAVLTGLSILSGLIGLIVTLPLIGHASWHLYRHSVGPVPEEA